MEAHDVGGRIRTLRKEKKMTQAQLAKVAGVSAAAVTQWEGGAQTPKAESLSRLADQFGVTTSWLLTGKDRVPTAHLSRNNRAVEYETRPDSTLWLGDDPSGFEEVEIPLYKESLSTTGNGTTQVIEEADRHTLRVSKHLLKASGVDVDAIACAINHGKSMERMIMDDAMIFIDTSKKQIKDDRIFAFDHGGMLRVKYLFKQPKGGLLIRSENRAEHPDEVLNQDEVAADIRIIGWVFDWSKLQKW